MSLSEILFLGMLGLVVFGPRKLAAIAPEVGKTLARLKSMSNDFKSQINTEISATASDRPMAQSPVAPSIVAPRSDK
jgi:Sec-independent protein translocase protein TatA